MPDLNAEIQSAAFVRPIPKIDSNGDILPFSILFVNEPIARHKLGGFLISLYMLTRRQL